MPSEFVTIESLSEIRTPKAGDTIVELLMTAEDRRRVRRRVQAPDGREFALALPTGTTLKPGQVVHREAGKAYVVTAAPEDVLVMRPKGLEEAVKLGHLIGNLHSDIDYSDGEVAVLWNGPLEDRLRREGIASERSRRPFHGVAREGHRH